MIRGKKRRPNRTVSLRVLQIPQSASNGRTQKAYVAVTYADLTASCSGYIILFDEHYFETLNTWRSLFDENKMNQ